MSKTRTECEIRKAGFSRSSRAAAHGAIKAARRPAGKWDDAGKAAVPTSRRWSRESSRSSEANHK